jgi:hypothetical protein
MCDEFIYSDPKQREVFLLIFNPVSQCASTYAKVNRDRTELDVTHQLTVCADVNLVGGTINTITTDTSLHASKVVGLKTIPENIKYIFMSRHQNAGQKKAINRSKI